MTSGVFSFAEVTRSPKWLALWAAFFGFLLDAMDVLLYVFAIPTLKDEFGLSNAQAGLVGSATLIASSFGGIAAGILCDRFGRKRTLIGTILLYSLASGGTATSNGLVSLVFWRSLVGLGLGGEWSAGAVLVAESWPAAQRARAVSLMQSGWAIGYMLAALISAIVLPRYGWRVLFLIGVLPALLTFFIRRKVDEPAIRAGVRPGRVREVFAGELGRRTLVAAAVATAVLLGYWGLFTWLPGFLSAAPEAGGAGFDIVKTSGWIFAMQIGAFFGYLNFGWLADRFGRRPAFASYVLMAAALTPIYGTLPRWGGEFASAGLLLLGPLIGFFGTGFFSLFGAMLAELYPTRIRGAGQGFVYNFGRAHQIRRRAGVPAAGDAEYESGGVGPLTPVALTIAGSDPSGGAGIQADLKTFHQFGVYGEAAIALLTVQNSTGVAQVKVLDVGLVRRQIEAVLADIPPAAVKTGALGSEWMIRMVARLELPNLVVDPVMISKHGASLMADEARHALAAKLLPQAELVTPNVPEAAALAGIEIASLDDMREAAQRLALLGPPSVLVKGGHLAGDAVDVLLHRGSFFEFRAPRIGTRHTHGTGCSYSAAITALLARGLAVPEAVAQAKAWITEAIRTNPGLGLGAGPVNHFAPAPPAERKP